MDDRQQFAAERADRLSRLAEAPGPLPEAGREPVETSRRIVPEVSDADRAEGARIAATIENPALREAVAKAAEASLAAGANRRI